MIKAVEDKVKEDNQVSPPKPKPKSPKQATPVAVRIKRLEERRISPGTKRTVWRGRGLGEDPGSKIQLGIKHFLRVKSWEGETQPGYVDVPMLPM